VHQQDVPVVLEAGRRHVRRYPAGRHQQHPYAACSAPVSPLQINLKLAQPAGRL